MSDANAGDVTVTVYKNQDNFTSGTSVTVNGDNFTAKQTGSPDISSASFNFSLAVTEGDFIQVKIGKSAGGATDTLVTIVLTET